MIDVPLNANVSEHTNIAEPIDLFLKPKMDGRSPKELFQQSLYRYRRQRWNTATYWIFFFFFSFGLAKYISITYGTTMLLEYLYSFMGTTKTMFKKKKTLYIPTVDPGKIWALHKNLLNKTAPFIKST